MGQTVLSDPYRGNLKSNAIGALDLEPGGRLDAVTVAYRTWGRLNAAGDNAVLGQEVAYAEIDSMHGHDAFLKEWSHLDTILRPLMGEQLLRRYRQSLSEGRVMATA